MEVASRSPLRLRWVIPIAVIAALTGGVAFATRSQSATPSLPSRSAAQLLAAVARARVAGLSGTVVETARLGLPALPSVGSGSASLTGLVAGSHTIRVWYAGSDKARVAVSGTLAESDIIRNGRNLWTYQSDGNTATHTRLPAERAPMVTHGSPTAPTPADAADRALAAIGPTTAVTVDRSVRVAGRDAYQLRLSPKDPRSLVDSVLVAVDGRAFVPLRVQVFATSSPAPAFETGFTSLQLRALTANVFDFTPPPGAKVSERPLPSPSTHERRTAKARTQTELAAAQPAVLGNGWTTVVLVRNVRAATARAPGNNQLMALLQAATPVQGAFGHGRLLCTALFTALLTDDGRLYVGAITPGAVQAAAALPPSAARPLTGRAASP
jgi:outer membrane lipoprotein-sorting protein